MAYPTVCPHDSIEQIADEVFMVRGSVKLNPILRLARNMAIVRHAGELTLINPLRLVEAELSRLDELGTVKHIVRMGAFHGQDDPFYMDRYKPRFWSQAGGTTYTEPAIDEAIDDRTTLPFPDAKVFRSLGEASVCRLRQAQATMCWLSLSKPTRRRQIV